MRENNCTMFPDSIFGVSYSQACKTHDIDYQSGIPKHKADLRLMKNGYSQTLNGTKKKLPKYLKFLSYPFAGLIGGLLYAGVNTPIGLYFYHKAQKERVKK